MPRKTLFMLIPLAVCVVSAQAPKGKEGGKGGQKSGFTAPAAIRELKPNLYMVSGLGGNTTVRVTDEGLIVVDTKNMGEENYRALMDVIRTKTQQPARFAVITHVHQDHSGNSASFLAAGAQVVAHENLKAAPAAPSITYSKDYTIRLGGTQAQLHHYGPAHTSGDTIVHFPDLRVVASGDTLVHFPEQPLMTAPPYDANGGSAVNWPKFLDEVLKLDFDLLVPGHGEPMTKDQVRDYKERFGTFVSRAIEQVRMGTPKDRLIGSIKVDDIKLSPNSYGQGARLDAFYAQLQAAGPER
jgi:glyoxylase-like metal-dependent hydrolase (beta-lactamase superfamily II)